MDDIKRIYLLLSQNNGLKIRVISDLLELDKHYVSEVLFSLENSVYWFQDDDSLWYAKEGSLQVEETDEKTDEILTSV